MHDFLRHIAKDAIDFSTFWPSASTSALACSCSSHHHACRYRFFSICSWNASSLQWVTPYSLALAADVVLRPQHVRIEEAAVEAHGTLRTASSPFGCN